MSDPELDLSKALRSNLKVPIRDFLLYFNSTIKPNSPPLRNTEFQTVRDFAFGTSLCLGRTSKFVLRVHLNATYEL